MADEAKVFVSSVEFIDELIDDGFDSGVAIVVIEGIVTGEGAALVHRGSPATDEDHSGVVGGLYAAEREVRIDLSAGAGSLAGPGVREGGLGGGGGDVNSQAGIFQGLASFAVFAVIKILAICDDEEHWQSLCAEDSSQFERLQFGRGGCGAIFAAAGGGFPEDRQAEHRLDSLIERFCEQTGPFRAPTDNGSPNAPPLRQEFQKYFNMPPNRLSGEVTGWIQRVRAGDSSAVQHLWNDYFQRMVQAARLRLQGASRGAADEEDVALSAFNSFCLGAQAGRFPQLLDSQSLWPLLLVITANKSVDLIRQNNRQRRGGGLERLSGEALAEALSGLMSREPGPEFTAELTDQLGQLLKGLDASGDPLLRQIALFKLEGFGNDEIAARVGCVRRSVERKLQVIARLWEQSEGDGE